MKLPKWYHELLESLWTTIIIIVVLALCVVGFVELMDVVDDLFGQLGVYTLFGSMVFGAIFTVVHQNSKVPKT